MKLHAHVHMLLLAVLLGGCLGPLQMPSFPEDDDDSAANDDDATDDDDSGQDDDDTGPDDDDTGPNDDDTVLDESGGGQRLCSAAGTASNDTYTVTTCTGPVEAAPGVVTNGTYTVRINKLGVISK